MQLNMNGIILKIRNAFTFVAMALKGSSMMDGTHLPAGLF